eukprot:TRINITY_DN2847_c0_g2_i1.p1 TRINITY_DN2847_c0_g2~~TRINITY_DN2847_c0_g2_i1.p1  ORF type:complete len:632 (+),score=166.30 TRINITY_DN2847_c0_g2_i1:151-2046(+)
MNPNQVLFCLSLLLFVSASLGAQFNGPLRLSSSTPGTFTKLEISFDLNGKYSNPYDQNLIDINANFLAPTGKNHSVPCFWMQSMSGNGGNFLCRFSPFVKGTWRVSLSAKDSKGTAYSSPASFSAVESGRVGFVKKSWDNLHFVRSHDSSTYFPIGENMGWSDNTKDRIKDYANWVGKLSQNGANYIRVWADGFNLRPEYQVGNYDSAKYDDQFLDSLLELTEKHQFTILWCLNYHGDFSLNVNSNWDKNPYNKKNGGPLSYPGNVWTDGDTFKFFERRYRYTIARWGYSTSVMAWELWNEMDWITDFNKNSKQASDWCKRMYDVIHKYDPYGHLITTSFALNSNRDDIDRALDFVQYHQYGDNHIQDFAGWISTAIPDKTNKFNKPAMVGEFGPSYQSGWYKPYTDATGVCIHNTGFASLMSGGGGGGFTWWWNNWVDPRNLYWRFKGLSSFVKGERLDGLKPASTQSSDKRLRSMAISDGRKTLGWVQSTSHTWWGVNQGWGQLNLQGATVKAPCSSGVNYNVQVWNSEAGTVNYATPFRCEGNSLTVRLPSFDKDHADWAYKLIPYGSGGNSTTPTPPSSTPATSKSGGKGIWQYCTTSSECAAGLCCSKQFSGDGKLKCTPNSNQCV